MSDSTRSPVVFVTTTSCDANTDDTFAALRRAAQKGSHNIETRFKQSLDDREIGGLGIYIVNKIVDKVEYVRKSEKNYLTLRKKIM